MKSLGELEIRNRYRIITWSIRGSSVLILIILIGVSWLRTKGNQSELLIAAAASMKPALEELLDVYRIENPEITVQITYGGSGTLEQQIRQGAPIDVFISASVDNMNSLSKDKLILDDTRVEILQNQIVLIEPSSSNLNLQGFDDLLNANKIAIGYPDSVPAGKYAYEVSQFLGIWENIKECIVYGKDVTEVLTWVASGNVDAGMVYSTDASSNAQVRVVAIAPEDSHSKIIYCAAVLDGAKEVKASRRFIDFLISKNAQDIFKKYGFLPVE